MRCVAPLLLLSSLLLGLPALAEEEAPAESAAGLVLEARVAPTSAESGNAVRLRATFVNRGSEPVEIYLPQHLGSVVFPRWRLVGNDGAAYAPHQPSFQSMWPRGLMGSILELAPGASRDFTHEVTHVVLQKDQRRSLHQEPPILLPPGRYTVRAAYRQADDTVPWALPNFRSEQRRHEGLWTGEFEADAGTLEIRPSEKPTLHLEAPEEGEPGRSYRVRVELRHAGTEPVQVHEVTFLPGATRVVEVDLARLDLHYRRQGATQRGGLHELIPVGLFHLDAAFRLEGEEEPLAAAGMFRRMQALDPSRPTGLGLRLEKIDGGGSVPRVVVVLRNESSEAVLVPATLAYPRNVFFALTREGSTSRAHSSVTRTPTSNPMDLNRAVDPGARARIEAGLSWDGDRWERLVPLSDRSFVKLPPGGELRRVFDLAELVAESEPLSHGAWVVHAFWRNRESGLRLGLEPPLVVGLVESPPLTLKGRGW